MFFFFKQKTAYEMRISDWSSDVCSSDLKMTGIQGLVSDPRFVGGKLNVAYNCVDRHVLAGNGDRVAIHFEGEPGDSRDLTYNEIGRASCRERVCQYV